MGQRIKSMAAGALWCVMAIWTPAHALDLVIDGKLNPQVEKGYRVQSGDLNVGHPIFTADGAWQFLALDTSSTSGTARSVPISTTVLAKTTKGALTMIQYIVVASGGSDGNGWLGDPCSGEKIVKINKIRQRLDRCAAAKIDGVRFDGKPTDVLKIEFTESNSGGRFYQVGFLIAYEKLGLTYATVSGTEGLFHQRLQAWMTAMLDAVVKAADYDKPADAYAAVPSFQSAVVKEVTSTTVQRKPADDVQVAALGLNP